METALYIAHVEADGTLSRHSLEALTAAGNVAAELGAELVVGLFGADVRSAADGLGACGAKRFLAAQSPELLAAQYASDAAAVEALARTASATIVIGAHTSRLARVAAGAALRLSGQVDTHVGGISGSDNRPAVTRWFYKQRIEGTVRRSQRPWVVLLDPGTAEPYSGSAAEVALECVTVPATNTRTRSVGVHEPAAGEQTIRPDAELLFVAGAGWTRKQKDGRPHPEEAERLILDFVRASRASLGSTKSLTEMGGEGQPTLHCLSHLNQVGQTGSTPRHSKGLSTCCHGEEPHVVGWRFIRERYAINLDANCGWARGKADVLYVADAFAVMQEINRLLMVPEADRGTP
jgi:electron transfer flavoprotein alpha subunit